MVNINIHIDDFIFDVNKQQFESTVGEELIFKFFKNKYGNLGRFKSRFLKPIIDIKDSEDERCEIFILEDDTYDRFITLFEESTPFTYEEAFKIQNDEFRALVFGFIDISDMINSLGANRIKVDGIPVKHKIFSQSGDFLGYEEYDNVYETYEVNGRGLGLNENIYAIKCWCTSTNKEHWLWIEDEYKDKPLEAIASTFRIHENLIPYIKELKRQGDILLVEMDEDIQPEGEIVPLTAEQYFSLLTCQS